MEAISYKDLDINIDIDKPISILYESINIIDNYYNDYESSQDNNFILVNNFKSSNINLLNILKNDSIKINNILNYEIVPYINYFRDCIIVSGGITYYSLTNSYEFINQNSNKIYIKSIEYKDNISSSNVKYKLFNIFGI